MFFRFMASYLTIVSWNMIVSNCCFSTLKNGRSLRRLRLIDNCRNVQINFNLLNERLQLAIDNVKGKTSSPFEIIKVTNFEVLSSISISLGSNIFQSHVSLNSSFPFNDKIYPHFLFFFYNFFIDTVIV